MRPFTHFAVALASALVASSAAAEPPPGEPLCAGEYADDINLMSAHSRELGLQSYSYCVRNTATYECVAYGADGNLRRTRHKVVAHGTALGYRQGPGETLLLTNDHVAQWPAVTDESHPVEDVPPGCKRISETLRIVDNESDDYEADDIPLSRVVTDPQLDAAVLRARTTLPILPWKIGRSAALRERNAVEVRGFPLGAFRALNVGKVISAYDHDDYKDWDHDDFVIDALLSAGNSGSPVLALSCKTGEFELVGLFHAAYSRGSALNVAIGIDQLRDLMNTLKRAPHAHSDGTIALDAAARQRIQAAARSPSQAFFPFGPLTAAVRAREDGALLFELFSKDFPTEARPAVVLEDLPGPDAFGELGRTFFRGPRGLRGYTRADLDAEGQAIAGRLLDGLRRDAAAFVDTRAEAEAARSREDFEMVERNRHALSRTVESRRDVASSALDLADRLGPHDGAPFTPLASIFEVPAPTRPSPGIAAVAGAPAPASAITRTPSGR